MSPAAARLQGVSVGYKDGRRRLTVVVADIDVELGRGELACLLGPNGAGKSTIMRTIAGLQPALAGVVSIDGLPLAELPAKELAKRLAAVLTGRVDVGALSGYAVAALGRHPYTDWAGRLADADRLVVEESLKQAGADDLAARPFSQMSDGERQRVLIARALAQQPRLLVLDEITAFLDLPRRVAMLRLLRRLAWEQGVSVLLSTHELDLAMRCADRIWLLDHDGRFESGSPEDLALEGALARSFSDDGVSFDLESGSFKLRHQAMKTIQFEADGLPGHWTLRMLERIGLRALTAKEQPADQGSLELVGESLWRWRRDGQTDDFHRLDALAKALRNTSA